MIIIDYILILFASHGCFVLCIDNATTITRTLCTIRSRAGNPTRYNVYKNVQSFFFFFFLLCTILYIYYYLLYWCVCLSNPVYSRLSWILPTLMSKHLVQQVKTGDVFVPRMRSWSAAYDCKSYVVESKSNETERKHPYHIHFMFLEGTWGVWKINPYGPWNLEP